MKDEARSQQHFIQEPHEFKGLLKTSEELVPSLQDTPESKLHRKATFLDELLRSISDPIFYKDISGNYIECNDAFSEFVGRSREEIIGRTDHDLFEKEVADIFRMSELKIMEEDRPRKNEERAVYPDGRHIFFETLRKPLRTPEGKLLGIMGISRDITDRKCAGDVLHDLKNEFFQIVNGSLLPIFVIDKDHRVVYWNKACENISGIAATEMIGTTESWRAFYPRKVPLLADLIADGQTGLIEDHYGDKDLRSSSIEGGYEARDYFPQIDKWVLFNAVPLRNKSGNVIGAIETLQDITDSRRTEEELAKKHEQLLSILEAIDEPVYVCDPGTYELLFANSPIKLAKKALQESEERFEAISTFAQDAIIAIDNEGTITFWNKAAERIFGYSREESLSQDVHSLLAPQDYHEKCNPAFSRFKETGKGSVVGKTLEMRAKKKDGTEFSMELSLSAVILKNKWTAVAVIRDITERKRIEDTLLQAKIAAENANRTKSEFLANMSHELRTPLNSIIGFSDVLLEGYFGELNTKQYRYLGNISNSGRHLLGIINDILDISKVESGKSKLELEEISVHSTLEEMMSFMQPLAAEKEIVLRLEIAPQPDKLLADKPKLKQVLYNLIGNAIKFTDIGGYVTIKARAEGNMVSISVTDTGIGIEAHNLKKLFRPFTQLDSSTCKRYEGTGLGLALAKELIEAHDGSIWVESEHGKGSTFTFTLPLDRVVYRNDR